MEDKIAGSEDFDKLEAILNKLKAQDGKCFEMSIVPLLTTIRTAYAGGTISSPLELDDLLLTIAANYAVRLESFHDDSEVSVDARKGWTALWDSALSLAETIEVLCHIITLRIS